VSPRIYYLPPVMLSSLSAQDLPLPRQLLPGHHVPGYVSLVPMWQLVEEHIEETLSFPRVPRQHHKQLNFTHRLERLIMEEIMRATLAVRIFTNAAASRRLNRALVVERQQNAMEATR